METTGLDVAILGLAIPATLGLVQVAKSAGLPDRWAGVAAVALGVLLGALIRLAGVGGGSVGLAAIAGLVAGLSAAGVWSGTRAALRVEVLDDR